jgi:hypothetical protein
VIVLAAIAALFAAAPATNECRGLQQCVPVKGPWVVVPVGKSVPRPEVQYELTCPRGYVVGGVDAELTDRAIDLAFLATSGSPVSPGTSTSRTIVFVARYVGSGNPAATFRPRAGCVPTSGGGRRTPTMIRAVVPPGQPTVRHTKTVRVTASRRIAVSCALGERLVSTNVARGLDTPTAPSRQTIARVRTTASVQQDRIVVAARGTAGAVVQVTVVCAGGR